MSGTHAHASGSRPVPLRAALVLTVALALLETGGGLVSGSLALLSDAAHVVMDVFALAIALAANLQAARPATPRRTFGYGRFEVLAALGNGGLLFAVTVLIVIEAVHRFAAPSLPQGGLMFVIAAIGFCGNAAIGIGLSRAAHDNINVRAALFHVASDALGALAVALGGALIFFTHAAWIDPALSLIVSTIIVVGVVRIVREAADVLLESAPPHAEVAQVRACIRDQAGVVDVHDLHVWTIGPGSYALSAHVELTDARISEASTILHTIEDRLREAFAIGHVTLQFECESCAPDDRIVCTQHRA